MSTVFFALFSASCALWYLGYNEPINKESAMKFGFSAVFWIGTMYYWFVLQAGTAYLGIVWLFLIPLTHSILMFIERNWYVFDDASENIRRRAKY